MNQVAEMAERFDKLAYRLGSVFEHEKDKESLITTGKGGCDSILSGCKSLIVKG
jgi:hypothetical protein